MDVNATRLLCTLFFLYSPYHSPSPPPPPPAPAPRRVSDSYHYGACPAAPRVQHAATCPAGFDATCHAASPSPLPSPVSLSLCLSLTLVVIPRACFLCLVPQTALDFHMNEPRRAEPGYLFVCLSWPLSSIPRPPSSCCCSCCVCLID